MSGPTRAWHTRSIAAVLEELGGSAEGLTSETARERLEREGPNRLPRAAPPALALLFVRQFASPLVYILAIASAVAFLTRDASDAWFILGVLLLNAAIGAWQEWRAELSTHALRDLLRLRARVLRDGAVEEIDAERLVAGDVVLLETGNQVPADLRLLRAHGLLVDESLLTGESIAVEKDAAWVGAESTPLADRQCLLFAGTSVVHGRATGIVVATGGRSAVGQLAGVISRTHAGVPPLELRLARFARVLGQVVLGATLLIALLARGLYGYDWPETIFFAIALAVAAIPEGLPVALTLALSVATQRMAKRGVIVRHLAAVEGLGSCTLIASDKTGTLTMNELTVALALLPSGNELPIDPSSESALPSGPELLALGQVAVLCNEAHREELGRREQTSGDPTDLALLAFGARIGLDQQTLGARLPQIDLLAFEPEQRFAATLHRGEDSEQTRCCVKGAHEQVLPMCAWASAAEESAQHARAQDLAARGFRVLAFAERLGPGVTLDPPFTNLAFRGFLALIDPLRPEVPAAIAAARAAGIRVVMVTGDHPATALAIARELGLARDAREVMTGAEFSEVPQEERARLLAEVRVFARMDPGQKLALVESAVAAGEIVAVTGDGANDAPALQAANIGVAMGRGGTDIAREAADLVIADDHFATIVAGIEEGRVAYANVRKVIALLLSANAAEVCLVLLALVARLPLPLLAVQLLWLNLVTEGIQHMALTLEPKEDDVLRRPPRSPAEPILDRLMRERILLAALVISGAGLAWFAHLLATGVPEAAARNSLLLLFVLFENVQAGNCRSETVSLFLRPPARNPWLVGAVALALTVHVLAMHWTPLRATLQTAPILWSQVPAMLGIALSLALAMELHKLLWRRQHPSA